MYKSIHTKSYFCSKFVLSIQAKANDVLFPKNVTRFLKLSRLSMQ